MPLPDRAELLTLMDLNWWEMCREMTRATPGGWIVERENLLLCGSPRGSLTTNMAIVAGPVSADTVRAETDHAFGRDGLPFTVWTREHADAQVESELVDDGFVEIHREPGMVFAGNGATPSGPPRELSVRAVSDDAGRAAYAEVVAEAFSVYGAARESTRSHFARLASVVGPTTQAFLAHHEGRAVAGATLCLSHGVGGIAWVGTLPDVAGRGYGTAVTWAVVREGVRRGARFMNLQASPMGEPMYRRLGFATPTRYGLFVAPA